MDRSKLGLNSRDYSTGGGTFECLPDLNSANGELEQGPSSPSIKNTTMHSHQRVPRPPVPLFQLGGNDEDPSRNSTHESSHSVCGQPQPNLDLTDKVDNTEDSVGNGARFVTANSGNHVVEEDPANTNTQPALQHEQNGLEIKSGFDKDNESANKSVKRHKTVELEQIQEFAKTGMTRNATAEKLEVSPSTLKRVLKDRGTSWREIKKVGKQSARSANYTNPAGHDYRPPELSHGEPVCSAINSSIQDEKVGNEDNSRVVKATRDKTTVRFDFSYSGNPSLFYLENLVASNLEVFNLQPGRFKLIYRDNENTPVTMLDDSHLAFALSHIKKPRSLYLDVVDFPMGNAKRNSLPKRSSH